MKLFLSLLLCVYVSYRWWLERNKRLVTEVQLERMTQIAIRDPLTNLYTRRFFNDRAEALEKEARRGHYHNVVVIFLDIDRFKEVNDQNGHDAGDNVLREVAGIVMAIVRRNDILAFRWGGEEMLFLGRGRGEDIAERIRHTVAEKPICGFNITVSLGVATFNASEKENNIPATIRRADEALFQAKRLGRNRVVVSSDPYQPAEKTAP